MSTKIKMIAMALLAILSVTVYAQNLRIDKVEVKGREIQEVNGMYDLGVLKKDLDTCSITIINVGQESIDLTIRGVIYFAVPKTPLPIQPDSKEIIKLCPKSTRGDTKDICYFRDEYGDDLGRIVFRYSGISSEDELSFIVRGGKWGAVDINGNTVIPFEYEHLEKFRDNEIKAKKNGKFGLIDRKNKVLIPFEYEGLDFNNYINENEIKAKKNSKWGLIDKSNKVLIRFENDGIEYGYKNGYAQVKRDGSYYVINKNNEVVYKVIYGGGSKYKRIMKNQKVGFIDNNNQVVIPVEYDWALGYEIDHHLWVKKNGKWGAIDINNHIVFPFEYEDMDCFDYMGFVAAKKNGKWGVVDKDNKVAIPFVYDGLSDKYKRGKIRAKKNEKWGVIDEDNKVVVPFEYEAIGEIWLSKMPAKKNGKWGKIDVNNTVITEFIYDSENQVK